MQGEDADDVVLSVAQALGSSLDLGQAWGAAAPRIVKAVGADHVALGVSVPGSRYDYQWFNDTLPEALLGQYDQISDHDFIRAAVARAPARVLRDHEMIEPRRMRRHLTYQRARELGAPIEQVMAVMLWHELEWTSGLSLYRQSQRPFSDDEARLFERLAPLLKQTVRNCREHALVQREAWLSLVVDSLEVAALLVDDEGREHGRTAAATILLERFFTAAERRVGRVPEPLGMHLRCICAAPARPVPQWSKRVGPKTLTATFVRIPNQRRWALMLKSTGIDEAFEEELMRSLSPRLQQIAYSVLEGLSNADIAARDARSLATIKQQVSEVYQRLGVSGRVELVQRAGGSAAG